MKRLLARVTAGLVCVPAALLVLIAPALAQPEPHDSLLARAPVLATVGPVVKLAAPQAIGGTGWGPFRRLCVARVLIDSENKEVPESDPSCFTVAQAREDGGIWQLEMRTDPRQGGPSLVFHATRDGDGAVGPVRVTPPQGVQANPAMIARLETLFRVAMEAHGMRRATLAPGAAFVLPVQAALADPDTEVEGGGFACVPDGTATLRDRPVLVATCRTMARTALGDGAVSRIDMAGHFAIDIATGLVLQHGYASFLFMEADPKKTLPNLRWRGVSRQSLE